MENPLKRCINFTLGCCYGHPSISGLWDLIPCVLWAIVPVLPYINLKPKSTLLSLSGCLFYTKVFCFPWRACQWFSIHFYSLVQDCACMTYRYALLPCADGEKLRVCQLLWSGQNGEVALHFDSRLPLPLGGILQSNCHPRLLPQCHEGEYIMD